MSNKIFCRHGYAPKCSRCRERDLLVGLLDWLLFGAAFAIVFYACVANAECRTVLVRRGFELPGERVTVCDLAPEPARPIAPNGVDFGAIVLPEPEQGVRVDPLDPRCFWVNGSRFCRPSRTP